MLCETRTLPPRLVTGNQGTELQAMLACPGEWKERLPCPQEHESRVGTDLSPVPRSTRAGWALTSRPQEHEGRVGTDLPSPGARGQGGHCGRVHKPPTRALVSVQPPAQLMGKQQKMVHRTEGKKLHGPGPGLAPR